MQGSREDILATRIGTEEVNAAALVNTEQVGIELDARPGIERLARQVDVDLEGSFDKRIADNGGYLRSLFHPAEVRLNPAVTFNHMQKRPYPAVLIAENIGIVGAPLVVFVAAGDRRIVGRQKGAKIPMKMMTIRIDCRCHRRRCFLNRAQTNCIWLAVK